MNEPQESTNELRKNQNIKKKQKTTRKLIYSPSLLSAYAGLYIGVRGVRTGYSIPVRDGGGGGLEAAGNYSAVVAAAAAYRPLPPKFQNEKSMFSIL